MHKVSSGQTEVRGNATSQDSEILEAGDQWARGQEVAKPQERPKALEQQTRENRKRKSCLSTSLALCDRRWSSLVSLVTSSQFRRPGRRSQSRGHVFGRTVIGEEIEAENAESKSEADSYHPWAMELS